MPTTSISTPHPSTVTLDVFAAARRPDLAELYRRGQADSHRRHLGGASLPALQLDAAIIILARTAGGLAVGGMRIHPRRPGASLPVERALGGLCPVSRAIADAPGPLVELCGTWVGAQHRGTDLAATLSCTTLAVTRALGARQIVGCAHQHIILKLYARFGAVVDTTLGTHPYPDPRYQTSVFWADPWVCPEAEAVDACAEALARGAPLAFIPTIAAAA